MGSDVIPYCLIVLSFHRESSKVRVKLVVKPSHVKQVTLIPCVMSWDAM